MNLDVKKHSYVATCFAKRPPAYRQVLKTKALLMRVSILAIFLSVSGLLMAGKGSGQDLSKVMVSVNFKNASLKSALNNIERQTRLPFTYKTYDISRYDNINYQASEISVARLLDDLLRNTDLRFEQVNSNIVIKKIRNKELERKAPDPDSPDELFDGSLRGKITGNDGQPLANASIQLVGTTKGTVANAEGEFFIEGVRAGNYKLKVSAVGFEDEIREVTIRDNDATNINFQLKARNTDLEEVVVTALGISRKQRSVGYSTQEVKGENLTVAKDQNVIGSLAGKIAGVQVSGSSAASMGGTQKIQIRGVNSVTGGGEPLIVVDNTPISNSNYADKNGRDFGNLAQDINPEDIESVSVLKGPAASALYGLRGQFGVILITTKKGSKNAKKPVVNFSSAFSVEKAANFMPLQDIYGAGSSLNFPTITINGVSTKYVDGSWDESWGPKMDGTPVRQQYSFYPADPDFGKETPFIPHPDNIKDYFVNGHTWNNNISFAGGGTNSSFRLSFNNTNITGIEPNTFLKRNNLNFSGSLNITNNLVVSAALNYANNKGQRPSQGYQALGSRNMYQWFERNLDMQKLKQYKYSDGTFYHWNLNDPNSEGVYEDMTPIDWNNPYFDAYENPSHDSRDRFFGNVGLNYTILPGLQVSGFIRQDGFTQNLDGRNAAGGRGKPSFWIGKYESKEINYEFLAQYSKDFGKISLNSAIGGNILTQRYTYLREETVNGLVTPGFYNIANSLDRPDVTNYLRKKEVRSAYGSVTLGYDNTYFLDASLRNDISSALPAKNNSYLYPSISGSFVFSELMKWKPLNYGKLRLSFAQAGSDIGTYLTTNSFALGDPYGGNFPMYVPDGLNNPDLEPSLGTAYEAGLDLKFLGDRLGLNFTYYKQNNKKAVLGLDVPGQSGFTSYQINAGNIENHGIELSLTGSPIKTRDFTWNSIFNASRNQSKVRELYPGLNSLQLDYNRYASVDMFLLANVGEAFGSLVGNAYQRDAKTGMILLDAANQPMYETGHNFGSVLPDYTGGWSNMFTWKNFDLSAAIDFQSGGQFFSWTKMLAVKSGQAEETAAINENGKNIRDPLGDGGGIKVTGVSAASGEMVSAFVNARTYYRNTIGSKVYEEWLFDASYIKMREIRLGYSFTREKFPKLPVRNINLAFITRNAFMIWQKAPKGINPSELATGASSLNWLETGQLATARSYGINLSVSF